MICHDCIKKTGNKCEVIERGEYCKYYWKNKSWFDCKYMWKKSGTGARYVGADEKPKNDKMPYPIKTKG